MEGANNVDDRREKENGFIRTLYHTSKNKEHRIKEIWKEVESIEKEKRRRHLIAAGFISLGVFLLFLSLLMFLERVSIPPLNVPLTFVLLASIGAISFGYGFYRMGIS